MSNPINDFYNSILDGRCKGCEYARSVVATEQWMFLGCYHKPYCGKRVAEIKECPKEGSDCDGKQMRMLRGDYPGGAAGVYTVRKRGGK